MKVLFITWPKLIGSSYYHLLIPAIYIQDNYGIQIDISSEYYEGYDLYYFFRDLRPGKLQAAELAKKTSIVWAGIDDAYWEINVPEAPTNSADSLLKLADRAIVTSNFFKSELDKRLGINSVNLRGSALPGIYIFSTFRGKPINIRNSLKGVRPLTTLGEPSFDIISPATPHHNNLIDNWFHNISPFKIKHLFTRPVPLYKAFDLMDDKLAGNFCFTAAPPGKDNPKFIYYNCKTPTKWWEATIFGAVPILPYNENYSVFEDSVNLAGDDQITYDPFEISSLRQALTMATSMSSNRFKEIVSSNRKALLKDNERLDTIAQAIIQDLNI